MNALYFYNEFKSALSALGLTWGEMEKAAVHGEITISFRTETRTTIITIHATEENDDGDKL